MSTQSADEFLDEGAGPPAFKFAEVGTKVKGDVVAAKIGNVYKYGTREPDTYDDGTPKKQLLVDLRTADGDVRLYCGKPRLKDAIRKAVAESGGRLSDGGTLTVKRIEDIPAEKAGFNPTHDFIAKFEPRVADNDDLDF